jgi:flagellar basal-body rod modification protein FlgD
MVTQPITNPTSFKTYAASNSSDASSGSASSATDSSSQKEVFLQLLVAQLKNQDPTTPSDPTAFVTQLAQFTQLEQTLAIRKDTDTLATALTSTKTTATT